ncbi:MAG: sugar phosphate isomerase/epimerase [Clostridia bacterium]|nr:sugar phosphate isomerase/epimerase [Clostridia bacterium]
MRTKLCIAANEQFGVPLNDQAALIADAGFDAVFYGWSPALHEHIRSARQAGLEVQSVHAPFGGCADLWLEDGEKGERALEELLMCAADCAKHEVGLMVSHAFIGFDKPLKPDEKARLRGLTRYGKLVAQAARLGVTVAFENTEGDAYLDLLLRTFGEEKNVGFCLDTGHEMCYNGSRDLLAVYGQYLIATHLNDNLGVKAKDGRITWHDDLHLLPFDGIADWEQIARRLKKTGFTGPLTFELNTRSKPNRHENDAYAAMPIEQYLAAAYMRACKVRALFEKACTPGKAHTEKKILPL